MASNKSDRSMSPSTLSEEGRRDLIARQHRALYGGDNSSFNSIQTFSGQGHIDEQTTNANPSMRVASPRGSDLFGLPPQHTAPAQQSTADEKATSPGNNSQQQQQQQAPQQQPPAKISAQPTTPDPNHSRTMSKSTTAPTSGPMGPIGSRPHPQSQSQTQNQPQNPTKRTTPPQANNSSSTFSFGQQLDQTTHDRQSAGTGSNAQQKDPTTVAAATTTTTTPSLGAWGASSGVWGNKIGSSVWS